MPRFHRKNTKMKDQASIFLLKPTSSFKMAGNENDLHEYHDIDFKRTITNVIKESKELKEDRNS